MKLIRNFCLSIKNNNKPFIKYIDYPSCINCIHFIQHNHIEYEYQPYDKDMSLSKCNKFGFKDVVSGKIKYELTRNCRHSNSMCELSGKYFVPIPIPISTSNKKN